MKQKNIFFRNQFHSQTSSKTYPYLKGEHMEHPICEYFLLHWLFIFLLWLFIHLLFFILGENFQKIFNKMKTNQDKYFF